MILSYLFAIAIPLLFLYVIWTLELYAATRPGLLTGAFMWGVSAFAVALLFQNTLIAQQLITYDETVFIGAPVFEEVLKAALLIYLVERAVLRYAADGAAYGFAIGTGFGIVENLFYLSYIISGVTLPDVLARVFSTSLMHAFTMGILGAIAGSATDCAVRARTQRVLAGLVLAILAHGLFNVTVTTASASMLAGVSVALGFASTLILVGIIGMSLEVEQSVIGRELHELISAGEVAATLHPEQVASLISEKLPYVGTERAGIIRNYITLQAQRGQLRRSLHSERHDRAYSGLTRQLADVEGRLKQLRADMGLYNWVWLRRLLPSEERMLWEKLDVELHTDDAVIELIMELNRRETTLDGDIVSYRMEVLRSSQLFADLDEDDVHDLAVMMEEAHFGPGEVVIAQNVINTHLYVVVRGVLLVSVFEEGLETILTSHFKGDYLGESSMLDAIEHPTQVAALEPVHLLKLSRADLLTLIYAKPQVGVTMLRKLIGELNRQTELIAWFNQTMIYDAETLTAKKTPCSGGGFSLDFLS